MDQVVGAVMQIIHRLIIVANAAILVTLVRSCHVRAKLRVLVFGCSPTQNSGRFIVAERVVASS